jgi:hypothetical protein
MTRTFDFIGSKVIVDNLRIKVNMLSSKLAADFNKTFEPIKVVCGVSPLNNLGLTRLDLACVSCLKTRLYILV